MALRSLGKITVAAAGTPVRVTANLTTPTERLAAHSFIVEQVPGNTGKLFIGGPGMNKTTLAGVYAILPIPTVNSLPSFSSVITNAPAGFNMAELFIDADVNGESALVSIIR
jgi:hypothetical protein